MSTVRPRWLVGSACLAVAVAVTIGAGGCDLFRDSNVDPIVPAAPDAAIVVADASGVDAGSGTDGFPLPRTDLVQHVGSADTLDIGTWNVRFLGTTGINNGQRLTDLGLLADIIASLDVDVLAVEEIASEAAWLELAKRLPDHEQVLSTHQYGDGSYQKVGFLYRKQVVTVKPVERLFNRLPFPRPPLKGSFQYDDGVHAAVTFDAIAFHLEAGGMAHEIERRRDSVTELDAYVTSQLAAGGEGDVVLLGDFNIGLRDSDAASLDPLRNNTTRYAFRTEKAALAGEHSHASRDFIDHIVTTKAFGGVVEAHAARVDQDPDVAGYATYISDHYPVIVSIPLAPR